jgi:hypothetical protein
MANPKKGFFWAMERNFGEILPLEKNLGLSLPSLIGIFILVSVGLIKKELNVGFSGHEKDSSV